MCVRNTLSNNAERLRLGFREKEGERQREIKRPHSDKETAPGFPGNQSIMVKEVKDMKLLFYIVVLLLVWSFFPSRFVCRLNLAGYSCCLLSFHCFFPRHATLVKELFFCLWRVGRCNVGKGSSRWWWWWWWACGSLGSQSYIINYIFESGMQQMQLERSEICPLV